jgi:hypothetical protein
LCGQAVIGFREFFKGKSWDFGYHIINANASLAVLREIGVDTGGSNVQFALNPCCLQWSTNNPKLSPFSIINTCFGLCIAIIENKNSISQADDDDRDTTLTEDIVNALNELADSNDLMGSEKERIRKMSKSMRVYINSDFDKRIFNTPGKLPITAFKLFRLFCLTACNH